MLLTVFWTVSCGPQFHKNSNRKVCISSHPVSGIGEPKSEDEQSAEAGPEDRLPPHPRRRRLCHLQLGQRAAQQDKADTCNCQARIVISIYEVFMVALYGSNADWPIWLRFCVCGAANYCHVLKGATS